MRGTRRLFLLAAWLWISGCADNIGSPPPSAAGIAAEHELRQLRWKPGASLREFSLLASPALIRGSAVEASPPVLSDHSASFWAWSDRSQSIQVSYRTDDGTWSPYVELSIPSGALLRRPDGTAFAPGDSILITATIDTTRLVLDLNPSGLVFSDATPAELRIWYSGADRDFDSNGVTDVVDSYIEQALLGVWVQESADAPWSRVEAIKSMSSSLFSAELKHFSGYAVSW